MDGRSHEAIYRKVVEQLDRARHHGLTTERDLFDYVGIALTTSDRFDEHPGVLACLADAKSKGVPVADAFSALSDRVWDDIARST